MSVPTVLVVGSANVDLVTRLARCPRPGETLLGESFATVPGGKGANQAVAAARLEAQTYFAGCVGEDSFGQMQREALAAEGIDLSYLKSTASDATGTAVIFVGDDGQNMIVVTPGANHAYQPEDVEKLAPLFREIDAVILQLEIPLDTVEAALALARQHDVLSVLDTGATTPDAVPLVGKADLVTPNESEAETLTGISVNDIEDAREAAAKLLSMGAKEAVLKLGPMGALYMAEDWFHVPAFDVEVVDTVAAGDAFTAALAIRWRGTGHKRDAIRFANAAGALATTRSGAQAAMPSRSDVMHFLEQV